ncbi:glycosyltransferase [Gorillibacterium sp. sgz5001074]|uniref:glycosyltransferase n=1 Tax=Gorillibacterium sp. sgz5001074 TaxID=3446695 RepID=UPI003F668555
MMLYKLLPKLNTEFECVVITMISGGPVKDKIEALGIEVQELGMSRSIRSITSVLKLIRLLNKIEPDLIQAWMYHANVLASLIAPFLKKRVTVVWNVRGSHYRLKEEKWTTALTVWLSAKLSRYPKAIINNSNDSAKMHTEFLKYPNEKTRLIPNGFYTDRFIPSDAARKQIRVELGVTEDAVLIGLISRYDVVKDHANFFAAAERLKRHPAAGKIYFLFAGRGMDHDNQIVSSLVEKHGLKDSVFLLGEREDMEKVIASLSISCNSSYKENFPNVIGESMSCGIPCVVTNVGDSAWIVGDTGLVVPPKDSEQLASALTQLVLMEETARSNLGRRARDRIVEHYSMDGVGRMYRNLYNELL